MRYYLAYGSNMVLDQMEKRCKDANLVSIEFLEGYGLVFKQTQHGTYLDMIKKHNSKIPVFIWEVSEDDEKNLDLYENYPESYIKEEITCSKGLAFVYLVNEKYNKLGVPTDDYLLPILQVYEKHGFDKNILLDNLKEV